MKIFFFSKIIKISNLKKALSAKTLAASGITKMVINTEVLQMMGKFMTRLFAKCTSPTKMKQQQHAPLEEADFSKKR